MNLVQALKEGIRGGIGVADVKAVIDAGGIVFAYPRKKQVSFNGGRARLATDAAVKLAYEHHKAKIAELRSRSDTLMSR